MTGIALKIDQNEPGQAFGLVQQSVPCLVEALNVQGYADYLWPGVVGIQQVERKTWNELLADTGSVEVQLRRQMQAHPDVRLMLVVEGVATSAPQGSITFARSVKSQRPVFYASKTYARPIQTVYAWLYQVEKFIEVHHTSCFEETMGLIVALYKADQRVDHTTFERYIRQVEFHPNPQVQRLLGMGEGLGIGPTRAEALIRKFGTVYNVLKASTQELAEVEGIGAKLASQLLRGVGRLDV